MGSYLRQSPVRADHSRVGAKPRWNSKKSPKVRLILIGLRLDASGMSFRRKDHASEMQRISHNPHIESHSFGESKSGIHSMSHNDHIHR